MEHTPLDISCVICSHCELKTIAKLALISKHWSSLILHQSHFKKIVIYSHVWSSAKLWLQQRPRAFDEVVIINYDRDKNELYQEVFSVIDTTAITKLTLYDMHKVDLSDILLSFTKLTHLKLYRPFIVFGNPMHKCNVNIRITSNYLPKTIVIPDILHNKNIQLTIES
jgi:hypothetical protein